MIFNLQKHERLKFQCFEDMLAWQKAQDLAVVIYEFFALSKDYKFKDQICDAVVSIPNNIAEGFSVVRMQIFQDF